MIVTRRRFFAGSAAVAVAGTAVAKLSLPRLLPAPNAPSVSYAAWTMGLFGEDGRELNCEGYSRVPLDMIEGDGYTDLVPPGGHSQVHWTFPGEVLIAGWGVWMPGNKRPLKINTDYFPQRVFNGTLTLDMTGQQGYILRLS